MVSYFPSQSLLMTVHVMTSCFTGTIPPEQPEIRCLAQEHNDNGSWIAPYGDWTMEFLFLLTVPLKEQAIEYLGTMVMTQESHFAGIKLAIFKKLTITPRIKLTLRDWLKATMVMACGSCLAGHQATFCLSCLSLTTKPPPLSILIKDTWSLKIQIILQFMNWSSGRTRLYQHLD